MLKSTLFTILILAIAVIGGAGSVWLALERDFGFDAITIGSWVTLPQYGTPNADPYSRARFSRDADLALGRGEGLVFIARHDNQDRSLILNCDYIIQGNMPPARFWTIFPRDDQNQIITIEGGKPPALHSRILLRGPDNNVTIRVSRKVAPGNWLATKGTGPFTLALTLFDTSLTSSSLIAEVQLPEIIREGCDG